MGAYQNNGDVLTKGRKTRGTVKNSSRLAAFAQREAKGHADWSTCEPQWILAAVHKITQLGGAVIFGLSRDGGSHSVTLMLDDSRTTLYFNGDADLSYEVEAVCDMLDDIAITS